MNNNHSLSIENGVWQTLLRVWTLIMLLVGGISLVQCLLCFMDFVKARESVSMLVVGIFYLITVFAFVAVVLFAFGVHRMCTGNAADKNIIIGFAMMILQQVDYLIYVSIHYDNDSTSYMILGMIGLVCYVIMFLYYQGMGSRIVAIVGAVLLVGCALLNLEEAIRYIMGIGVVELRDMYYIFKEILNTLIAGVSLIFMFGIRVDLPVNNKL